MEADDLLNILKRTLVPGVAFLGAGISLVGAFYQNQWLSFIGTTLVAVAALAAAIWQAKWEDKIERQGETIARQSIRIENLVTGGDSFAYIAFSDTDSDEFQLIAVNPGEFPLYELGARLVDVSPGVEAGLIPSITNGDLQLPIGTVAPASGIWLPQTLSIPFGTSDRSINIFFFRQERLLDTGAKVSSAA